ncbi:glutamate-5-semialdehyde dehydrogenase [Lentzea albida]|uniref:Gamma-glutamyl phosphate reductase n=1 Tax=Lentzea albida TaxID=65499 RepID=A0A1H9V5K8_9PSEU|nr:glutamate-5-semialdehyde dehydrogenase [Lentzea albida]SES17005.1 glutamate-5-semialdehyde dehydrogenase [Lentzea albida]
MIETIVSNARRAAGAAPPVGDPAYAAFAGAVRRRLVECWEEVVAANEADVRSARDAGLSSAMAGRMGLTAAHRDALVELTHRVQEDLPGVTAPGPRVRGAGRSRARTVARPLGVLLMIYESRPMVTLDSAVLAVCTGNAVLLRGGSECRGCNTVLAGVIASALRESGLPEHLAQVLLDTDRAGLRELMKRDDAIDVLLPRGGAGLVSYCRTASRIPVIAGGAGVNHLYAHSSADPDEAVRLVLDSKLPDPAGCTALEMLLLDEDLADDFFTALSGRLGEPDVRGLVLRAPADLVKRLPDALTEALEVRELAENDDGREFLDTTLGVRVVSDVDEAVRHVRRFGTGHTEGVVARSAEVVDHFTARVDAAAVVVNGSLRLHDGPTMGTGPEMAISTGRLHVRGPVGLAALLTRSWVVDGGGTVRFRRDGAEGEDR